MLKEEMKTEEDKENKTENELKSNLTMDNFTSFQITVHKVQMKNAWNHVILGTLLCLYSMSSYEIQPSLLIPGTYNSQIS